jgi:hypothetical protein
MVPLDGLGVNWLTTCDLFSYENNIYRTLLAAIIASFVASLFPFEKSLHQNIAIPHAIRFFPQEQ